jgi:4-hydroxy-tetrahydrodipicolinate synthase
LHDWVPALDRAVRESARPVVLAAHSLGCLAAAWWASLCWVDAFRDKVRGALLVAPYYNKPSQEGLFRHFQAIAQATGAPIMLYNIPGRCAVDVGPETVERLAMDCANIVSIKEAGGSVDRVSELRARLPEAFTILSGDDSLTLPFMSVGAVGVVSVASNLFPAEVVALVQAFRSGDTKRALEMHLKMLPIFKDLFIEPNPVPVKTALSWRGAMSAECRLPLCEMTAANQERLRNTIEAFERANK